MRAYLFHWLIGLISCGVAGAAQAVDASPRIYRCGQSYTNQPDPNGNCKLLSGAQVTVIEGTRIQNTAPSTIGASAAVNKVDVAEQRQRDAQAQVVLHMELQKAQKQHAELLREWNNGEPERRADELRQPQKYQERVQQLRASVQRAEADVAGLQRELSRVSGSAHMGAKP